jgi:multidrug resistance efflux pump
MYNHNIKSAHPANNRKGMVRLHVIPVLVWLGALAGVVFLFSTRIQRFEVIGMAHSKTWQISSETTSRIKNLNVELFARVTKDQIIASLDSEFIKARLNTIKAEAAKLAAELNAAKDLLKVEAQDRRNDLVAEHRRFSANVESAKLAILELKAIIEPDRILLKDYQAEIDIEMELRVTGATTSVYNIQKAQAQYDTLARKIEKNEELLAQAKINTDATIKRRDDFLSTQSVNPSPDIALAAISKAIDVQMQLMEELIVQSESLTLKSPADGIVTEIYLKTGEVVTPGLAILKIAQTETTEVIAYASDSTHNIIKQGQKVQLVKNGATPQIAHSQITQIGPAIDIVPERLQTHPDLTQWGRPFLVKIPPGMKLAPGEKVGIRGLHQ